MQQIYVRHTGQSRRGNALTLSDDLPVLDVDEQTTAV